MISGLRSECLCPSRREYEISTACRLNSKEEEEQHVLHDPGFLSSETRKKNAKKVLY